LEELPRRIAALDSAAPGYVDRFAPIILFGPADVAPNWRLVDL